MRAVADESVLLLEGPAPEPEISRQGALWDLARQDFVATWNADTRVVESGLLGRSLRSGSFRVLLSIVLRDHGGILLFMRGVRQGLDGVVLFPGVRNGKSTIVRAWERPEVRPVGRDKRDSAGAIRRGARFRRRSGVTSSVSVRPTRLRLRALSSSHAASPSCLSRRLHAPKRRRRCWKGLSPSTSLRSTRSAPSCPPFMTPRRAFRVRTPFLICRRIPGPSSIRNEPSAPRTGERLTALHLGGFRNGSG